MQDTRPEVADFDDLPFTKRELLEQIQGQINRPLIAVYWTGSRVNELENTESDYDVIAITDVTSQDLLEQNSYRTTIKTRLYKKDLEIKVLDIVSLYQSLVKSNWILLEALSQRSITTDPNFQVLFRSLSNSNWLISSCPSRYAKAAIGQSLAIKHRIETHHRRWRHDLYYIAKLDNYLSQCIDHADIYSGPWHLQTLNLKPLRSARESLDNIPLSALTPEQALPIVKQQIEHLTTTANQFEQLYSNYDTTSQLTQLFTTQLFPERRI